MRTELGHWSADEGITLVSAGGLGAFAGLVLGFGAREILEDPERYKELQAIYPNADIILSSTSGEILGAAVSDDTLVFCAISFEKTTTRAVSIHLSQAKDSREAGAMLASGLNGDGLRHVLLLSDGLHVNGSELVKGMNETLHSPVPCTGGLAGDANRFERTVVGLNSVPGEGVITAVGFYGQHLEVGYGSVGGWDHFGAERLVTRSEGNVLYELDGQSALDLYKLYLGDRAAELPGSALLFPLGIRFYEDAETIVRTVLGVDETAGSLTFAGDIPEGCYVQLMKADFNRLIDGARLAAMQTAATGGHGSSLALLISCVGRKQILGDRSVEEVLAVQRVLGQGTAIIGFYSYGEISPVVDSVGCELHNQTMTITTFFEN
jgi:hypothetical protein